MARHRSRTQRTFLLLLALLLLFLLFELDQWLPGTWRGGSGGGFRSAGEAALADPRAAAPDVEPPSDEQEDPNTVRPPESLPPEWPPKQGIIIEVRGPDGDAATGWRLGTGDGGAEDGKPDEDGHTLRRDDRLVEQGFRIRTGGRIVRHRGGTREPASRWIVHLPAGQPPEQRQPGKVRVEVTEQGSRRPLAGVTATLIDLRSPRSLDGNDDGVIEVPTANDGAPMRVLLAAKGHVEQTRWIAPRSPATVHAALPVAHPVRVTLRWPDGTPARFSRVEARSADGRVLARQGGLAGGLVGPEIALDVPATALEGGTLHVRPVRAGEEGLRVDLPLEGLAGTQSLPETRSVRVLVRDVDGHPVDHAQVLVYPEAGESTGPEPTPWRVLTNTAGEARVATPVGHRVALLVSGDGLGPLGRRLGTFDGGDGVEFVLEQGVQIPVQVVDEEGGPIAGATLAARGVSEGVRVERTGASRTDAQGRANLGPMPEGEVEVYATAAGRAWSSTVVDARHAMGTVRMELEAAARLRLVVSDPFGIPLEGVRVDVTVASGGAPLAAPPGEHAARTDARGEAVLGALPQRTYDVTLTSPAFAKRVLRGVVPSEAVHFVTLLRR